jgi:hypothetical protein
MEHLFRLLLTRPAVTQDEDAPSVRLAQDSQFQMALAQAQQQRARRDAMKAVARQFIASAGFVGNPEDLPLHEPLKTLDAALDAIEQKEDASNGDISTCVLDWWPVGLPAAIQHFMVQLRWTSVRRCTTAQS